MTPLQERAEELALDIYERCYDPDAETLDINRTTKLCQAALQSVARETLEAAAQETCGYCDPKATLNLFGKFDETGKFHIDSVGSTYPCKAWRIRALANTSARPAGNLTGKMPTAQELGGGDDD